MEPQDHLPVTDSKPSGNGPVKRSDVPIVAIDLDHGHDRPPATTENIIEAGSSPAKLLFQNDLIMSEVYKQIGIIKKDLINCLLISKANFGRVAMELYRHIKEEAVVKIYQLGCDSTRLNMIHDSVRTLVVIMPELTGGQERRYGEFDRRTISRFANLSELEISEKLPEEQSLRIQMQSTISGFSLLVTKFDDPEGISAGPFRAPGSMIAEETSSVITSITLFIPDDEDDLYQVYSASLIMDWVRGTLRTWPELTLLQVFLYEHGAPFYPDDLADFLLLCPLLTMLSATIADAYSTKKLEAILSSGSSTSRLKDITLAGADLRWLVSLERFDSVSLEMYSLPTDAWLHDANAAGLADGMIISQRVEIGKLKLTFGCDSVPDHSAITKFIEAHSTGFAEVLLAGRWPLEESTEWIDQVRSNLNSLKKEKETIRRKKYSEKPGFYLMPSPVPQMAGSPK